MMASDSGLLYIMYIIGTRGEGLRPAQDVCCPVTAIMSFDSHLVVSHAVVTAIMSSRRRYGSTARMKILQARRKVSDR